MLLVHDTNHRELNRQPIDNFGHVIAESLGIAAALVAGADFRRAGNDLINTLQMLGQFVATGMILRAASFLVSRIASLGRRRPTQLQIRN